MKTSSTEMRDGCVSVRFKKSWTPNHFCALKLSTQLVFRKFFEKFPFGDTILQDLGIVQPTKTNSYTVSTIKWLAKRFPQIELDSLDSLHLLAQEFTDFLLSPENLPALRYYKDCNEVEKLLPELFWWEVGKIKTPERVEVCQSGKAYGWTVSNTFFQR